MTLILRFWAYVAKNAAARGLSAGTHFTLSIATAVVDESDALNPIGELTAQAIMEQGWYSDSGTSDS